MVFMLATVRVGAEGKMIYFTQGGLRAHEKSGWICHINSYI